MFERFSPQARAAVERAETNARSLGAHIVNPEHVALGLLEVEGSTSIMAPYGLDEGRMRQTLAARSSGMPVSGNVAFSSAVPAILRQAFRLSIQSGSETVDPRHLWGALLGDQGVIEVMEQLNVDVAGARVGLQRLELQASQERMQRAQGGADAAVNAPSAPGAPAQGDAFSFGQQGPSAGQQPGATSQQQPSAAPAAASPLGAPQAPSAPAQQTAATAPASAPLPPQPTQPAQQRPAPQVGPAPAQQAPAQQAPAVPSAQPAAEPSAPAAGAAPLTNPFDSASDEFLPSFDTPSEPLSNGPAAQVSESVPSFAPEPNAEGDASHRVAPIDDPWAQPVSNADAAGQLTDAVGERAQDVGQNYRSAFSGSDLDTSNDPWGLPDDIPTFDPAGSWPGAVADDNPPGSPVQSSAESPSNRGGFTDEPRIAVASPGMSPPAGVPGSGAADGGANGQDYLPQAAPAPESNAAYQPDATTDQRSTNLDAASRGTGHTQVGEAQAALADPDDVDAPTRMREPEASSDVGQPGPVCGFCGAQLDLSYGTFEVDGHAFQGLMCRSCHSLVSAWPAPLD